jgi:outer membrane protein assembly factor BamB
MPLRRAPVLALALLAGCGARSELDTGSSSPPAAEKPPNGCTSDLLAGAPTPMRGYCSTLANIAPGAAPSAPQIALTVPLGLKGSTYATGMVVDPAGRVFVTLDTNVMSGVQPRTITAIDPDGTQAWSKTFDWAVSGLFLGGDGHLRARVWDGTPHLVTLDRDGDQLGAADLPDHQFSGFAVGADGSLYSVIDDIGQPGSPRVAKLAPDGTPIWTSPALDPDCGSCSASDIALVGSDGRPVIAISASSDAVHFTTRIYGLAPDGSVAWEQKADGLTTQGPAAASDGSLRIAIGRGEIQTSDYTTILHAFGPDGAALWEADTHDDPEQTWGNPLVVTPDGITLVHAFGGLDAVDAKGHLLWHHAAQTNLYYDAFGDPNGMLVVQVDGKVRGLSAATGEERWTLDLPQYPYGLALGPKRSMAVLRGEALVLTRDP